MERWGGYNHLKLFRVPTAGWKPSYLLVHWSNAAATWSYKKRKALLPKSSGLGNRPFRVSSVSAIKCVSCSFLLPSTAHLLPTQFVAIIASDVCSLSTVLKISEMKIWGHFPLSLFEVESKPDLLISETWKMFLTGKIAWMTKSTARKKSLLQHCAAMRWELQLDREHGVIHCFVLGKYVESCTAPWLC